MVWQNAHQTWIIHKYT